MNTYLVAWEIELDADNPVDAARMARAIQLDPVNIASEFTVQEYNAQRHCFRPKSVQIDTADLPAWGK